MSTAIRWIDTDEALSRMAVALSDCGRLAFDTEFDSYSRTYGFTLLLMQVYDGETVFLIDPLAVRDLRPVWNLMEDDRILKVGYAMGEDVRLMKSHGCHPRNLCDIAVSRRLCNKPEAGLARALEEDLGVILDKSFQRSDWSRRPLSEDQIAYLSNDVIHLFALCDLNDGYAADEELRSIYEEEMRLLEAVEFSERVIELSRSQMKRFGPKCQEALLAMLELREEFARRLNVPANYIVQTERLEQILENRDAFLSRPMESGYHPRVRNHEGFRRKLLDIVHGIPDSCEPAPKERTISREESMTLREARLDREERIMRDEFLPMEQEILSRYPEEVARFILRGLRKAMVSPDFDPQSLRPYQHRLVMRFRKS
jgi:ribonuclease D